MNKEIKRTFLSFLLCAAMVFSSAAPAAAESVFETEAVSEILTETVDAASETAKYAETAEEREGLEDAALIAEASIGETLAGTEDFVDAASETVPETESTTAAEETETEGSEEVVVPETPVMKGVSITCTGVKVNWEAVEAASSYRIYYREGDADWTVYGDASDTGAVVPESVLSSGKKYAFSVSAVNEAGEGPYDPKGRECLWIASPVISSIRSSASGLIVSWNAVSGVPQYRVFYRVSGTTGWKAAGQTDGTSFEVKGLTEGETYDFTVRCMDAEGRKYISSYRPDGTSFTCMGIPSLVSTANGWKGVTLTWSSVPNAVKYRIYYKEKGGRWKAYKAVGNVTGYTIDKGVLTSGKTYVFTVRAEGPDGSVGCYDTEGISRKWIAPPEITGAKNAQTGITVSWNKVTGADQYRVFYKTAGGKWVNAGNTASNSFTVKNLTAGNAYAFTVRCVSAGGQYVSGYDPDGITCTCLAVPALKTTSNAWEGVTLTWSSVPGAVQYRIYYKEKGGSWKAYRAVGDVTKYTIDKGVLTSGKTYVFTVRAVSADGSVGCYDTAGISREWIAPPELTGVKNAQTGITVSWNKVAGADQYRVFYKTVGGKWANAGNTAGTSFTVKNLAPGTRYVFTVRCMSAGGQYVSGYDPEGKTLTRMDMPKASVTNSADGAAVTWESVAGASGYRVYYREEGGSWVKYTDTADTGCTVPASVLTEDRRYYYTVRAKDASGDWSALDSKGTAHIWWKGGIEQTDWAAELLTATKTDQMLLVQATGNTATISLHTRTDGIWKQTFTVQGYVGRNGINKTVEGDGKTPTGSYTITKAFGKKDDPGITAFPYTKLDPTHYWIGTTTSPYYNQFVSSRDVKTTFTSQDEHLINYSSYNYVLSINYNEACIPGKGSAIFIHCSSGQPTAGCVSMPEAYMITLMKKLKADCAVIIDTKDGVLKY